MLSTPRCIDLVLLSGEDNKKDPMNEVGVALIYLWFACSVLKIELVKVGYYATSSAHFFPHYAQIIQNTEYRTLFYVALHLAKS